MIISRYLIVFLNKTKLKSKLVSKTWTRCFVSYERHHQYQIYDPAQQVVYIRCNVIFDKNVVELTKASPASDTLGNTDFVDLLFLKLSLSLIFWLNEPNNTAQILDPTIFTEVFTANSVLQMDNRDTFSTLFDILNESEKDNPAKFDKLNIPLSAQQ